MHKVGGSESWVAEKDISSVINDLLNGVGTKGAGMRNHSNYIDG